MYSRRINALETSLTVIGVKVKTQSLDDLLSSSSDFDDTGTAGSENVDL
jgi:hypothetical protein